MTKIAKFRNSVDFDEVAFGSVILPYILKTF